MNKNGYENELFHNWTFQMVSEKSCFTSSIVAESQNEQNYDVFRFKNWIAKNEFRGLFKLGMIPTISLQRGQMPSLL